MFEDQQTGFTLLVNKLNRVIASIRPDLRRHALDIGNHMCQMARLNRIVSAQHDLNTWRISAFLLEADAYKRKTLLLRLRPSLAKHLKPGRPRLIAFTEFG
jgi:hypothetical protein